MAAEYGAEALFKTGLFALGTVVPGPGTLIAGIIYLTYSVAKYTKSLIEFLTSDDEKF
jgi:hypothetical protein